MFGCGATSNCSTQVIIFDSPPVLPVADATILGALCSGVILVVNAGRTRSPVVRRAKETLDQLNLKVIGAALNRLPPGRARDRHYSHYYSYAQDGRKGTRRRKSKASPAPKVGPSTRLTQPIDGRPSMNGRSQVAEPAVEDDQKVY